MGRRFTGGLRADGTRRTADGGRVRPAAARDAATGRGWGVAPARVKGQGVGVVRGVGGAGAGAAGAGGAGAGQTLGTTEGFFSVRLCVR
ncbi:hypothetical protein GCM10018791_37330 [Streptomyces zaomyceticus]|nr:hypothetical protein GCM10018791_37330 [Streptomyces zaomyceticus]